MLSRGEKISDGISAGLKLWLFFLLCFYWLGYSALLSIILGAIGAFAGGLLVGWWKTKDDSAPKAREAVIPETEATPPRRQSRLGRQRRSLRGKKRKQQSTSRSTSWWPFKRRTASR